MKIQIRFQNPMYRNADWRWNWLKNKGSGHSVFQLYCITSDFLSSQSWNLPVCPPSEVLQSFNHFEAVPRNSIVPPSPVSKPAVPRCPPPGVSSSTRAGTNPPFGATAQSRHNLQTLINTDQRVSYPPLYILPWADCWKSHLDYSGSKGTVETKPLIFSIWLFCFAGSSPGCDQTLWNKYCSNQ